MQAIQRDSVLVSPKGGLLDLLLDGEVLASIFVPAGLHVAAKYVDDLPPGVELIASDTLTVVPKRSRVGIQPYGDGSMDSGANPDFHPTSASRLEREMRVAINRMNANSAHYEARQRAVAAIERIPDAPLVEAIPDAPVQAIPDAPAPAPAAEARAGG